MCGQADDLARDVMVLVIPGEHSVAIGLEEEHRCCVGELDFVVEAGMVAGGVRAPGRRWV